METRNYQNYDHSDPDFIEQNTFLENYEYLESYSIEREKDQYQYQEEFIEDNNEPVSDYRTENIPNEERIVNEVDGITNDEGKDEWQRNNNDLDYENDTEKEDDLDDDETDDETNSLDDFEAEHFPETHPRE